MYEWAKAFHLIAMTAWFAALFYLPRLFVYHAMAEDSISIERFKIMQRKLYRGIANPSMIATLGFGIWLLSLAPDYYLKQDWFIAKIAVVLAVVGYHYSCSMHLNRFATDILVVVKPF
jgi:putative membrane protein